MDAVEFILNFFVFSFIFFFLIGIPLIFAITYVADYIPKSDTFGILLLIFLISLLVGISWLARKAASLRVLEKKTYRQSISGAILEGRMMLSFLPYVGSIFKIRE